jgi:hypothetical protein
MHVTKNVTNFCGVDPLVVYHIDIRSSVNHNKCY